MSGKNSDLRVCPLPSPLSPLPVHRSISTWHCLFSGFLQAEGEQTGFLRLWHELHAEHAHGDTVVRLDTWDHNPAGLAALVANLRNRQPPRVFVYGYSWGGHTAVEFCRKLADVGVMVEHLVLCDAVYRPRLWTLRLLSLFQKKRHVVPTNVRRVTWFRQRHDFPRGHDVVAADPRQTKVDDPWISLSVGHVWMDDLPEFRSAAQLIARGWGEHVHQPGEYTT